MLALLACDGDTEKTQDALLGRWTLVKAFRNQRETRTLEGVFFEFGADGKMVTNLPVGAENPTDYEVEGKNIRQKSPTPLRYTVKGHSDSTLVLEFALRGFNFELQLQRGAASTAPEEAPPLAPTMPSDSGK
jgi:hypothetical protein